MSLEAAKKKYHRFLNMIYTHIYYAKMNKDDLLTVFTAYYIRDLYNVARVFLPETVVVVAVESIFGFGKHQISFNQVYR